MRRLPSGIQRGLFIGRRWQRRIVAQLRSRWHRSLQLRVVSTTLVLSALVIAVLGFFLVQSIAAGLLTSAENSARNQVENGAGFASDQNNLHVLEPQSQFDSLITAETLTSALQKTSGSTGSYLVFIQLTDGRARRCAVGGPARREHHGHHPAGPDQRGGDRAARTSLRQRLHRHAVGSSRPR